jgi:hypothetical protein
MIDQFQRIPLWLTHRKNTESVECIISWTSIHLRILNYMFMVYRYASVATLHVLISDIFFSLFVEEYKIRSGNSRLVGFTTPCM